MENIVLTSLQSIAKKMEKAGRTEYREIRRPRWKEYSLVKYEGKKVVSREKIRIDESKIFPSDEDFFWEPELDKEKKQAA